MSTTMAVDKNESNTESVPAKKVVEIKSLKQWYGHATKNLAKNTCAEFLSRTRAFLCEDESRRGIVRPLLNQWDWNKISADDCVKQLFQSLIAWEANRCMQKAVEDIHKKNWMCVVKSEGKEVATEFFDNCMAAEGWACRRLVENASDATATITAKLEKTVIELDRHTALYRLRKVTKHPFMKITSSMGGGLGWGHKAREHRYYFSRG